MNKRRQLSLVVIAAVMAVGLLAILAAWASLARSADAGLPSLQVDYKVLGSVDLQWGTTGVFSDTSIAQTIVPTSTALSDLGEIDLSLWLQNGAGSAVSGYVELDNTLVFTGTGLQVNATMMQSTTVETVGPAVSGTYIGNSIVITSERTSHTTQAGQTVQRQFWLSGTVASNSEVTGTLPSGTATGQFRETIWGYELEALTIVGNFELQVVSVPAAVPTSVSAGGFGTSGQAVGLSVVAMVVGLVGVTVLARWWFRPKTTTT